MTRIERVISSALGALAGVPVILSKCGNHRAARPVNPQLAICQFND